MKNLLSRAMPAAILAAAWLMPSAEAAAGTLIDPWAVPTRTVSYSDLNLRSDAGIATLHARIAQAAKAVCGGMTRTTLEETQFRADCREQAIADAVVSAKSPLLTRYHAGRVLLSSR